MKEEILVSMCCGDEMKEEILVSMCCGEEMPDYPDNDLCPRCKEHTGVLILEEE